VKTDLRLDHLGYDGDRTRKYRRDIPLLERAVIQDPGRVYLWYALGVAYQGIGEAGSARAAWERGLEEAREWPTDAGSALAILAALADERHRAGESGSKWIRLATDAYGDHPLTLWMRAREAHVTGAHAEAVPLLERLTTLDPDEYMDRRLGVDGCIFREGAYELLGTSWLQLGDPLRAADWLGRAVAETGGSRVETRLKLELAQARSRGADAAQSD
jgi:tetratricopeptide (TPR) repeat protein